MNKLNKTFDIISSFGNELQLESPRQERILELIEEIKEEEVTLYCRNNLHELVERSKEIFNIALNETSNIPNKENVKAFASLLGAMTATITALDKINETKSRKTEEELNQTNIFVSSEDAIRLIKERMNKDKIIDVERAEVISTE